MNINLKKIAIATAGLLLCAGLEASAENLEKKMITVESSDFIVLDESLTNLQNVDGIVPVAFTINVAKSAFSLDHARVYFPALVNGDWRMELPPVIVQGRNYAIVKGEESRFKEENIDNTEYMASYVKPIFKGIEVPYQIAVAFEDEMRGSQLVVDSELLSISRGNEWWTCTKKETQGTQNVVNNGIIDYTNFFVYNQPLYTYESEMISEDFGTNSIFKIKSLKVEKDVFEVPFENLVSKVKELQTAEYRIDSVIVKVAASPDGPLKLNEKLAEGREEVMRELMAENLPELTEDVVTYIHIDENWDDFVDKIMVTDLYNVEVASIINEISDLDEREKALRKTSARKDIVAIYKTLRNGIAKIYYTAPRKVTIEDSHILAYSSTSLPNDEFVAEYEDESDMYVINDAMVDCILSGDYATGFELSKILSTMDMEPEIVSNVAIMLTFMGDYPMAKHYFDKINTCEIPSRDYNLAMMYMHAKDYKAASCTFGDKVCVNSIVANIAAEQYDKAVDMSLDSYYSDAEYLYLRALAYTFTQDDDLMLFTLRQACELDPAYKELAKNQAEFIPFRENEVYKNIVK